jgi:hypothetical protein
LSSFPQILPAQVPRRREHDDGVRVPHLAVPDAEQDLLEENVPIPNFRRETVENVHAVLNALRHRRVLKIRNQEVL